MKSHSFNIRYSEADSQEQLAPKDKALFEKAVEAMDGAYAPYSLFRVGAAVLLEDGTVVMGSNQENMAYPSGLCAERVALFAAAASHPGKKVSAIAVVANPLGEAATVSPCGGCRQVIMEYQRLHKSQIRILTGSLKGKIAVLEDAAALLPLAFFDPKLSKK
jgi:cytidine deaminase